MSGGRHLGAADKRGRAAALAREVVGGGPYRQAMSRSGSAPDAFARGVSHALVGLAVAALVGRTRGPAAALAAAVVAAWVHDLADAPVAGMLAAAGV